jgi:AAA ATPase-like protein
VDGLLNKLSALIAEYFKNDKVIIGTFGSLKKACQGAYFLNEREQAATFFIKEKLHPRLIYFPDYKVIDGIIDVQQYLQAQEAPQKRSDIGYQFQKAETIRNLFHLAELDPAQLDELAADPPRLNSALVRSSQRLTKMLSLTWRARKVGIRLNYSSGTLTVAVSDVFPDGTTKNEGLLDRRSAGFKWHFSFFVNFRAGIQQNTFKDSILLLDEPGLNLHPEQQAGLIDVIRDLSQTNQVLYTTHSPFMIYNFDRGNLLVVEFDPASKASRIQQNFWDGDWQTIRPVLHSIGDSMLLKVFRGSDVLAAILAVEGITDQRYLVTIAELDVEEDQDSRLGGIEPIPSGGHALVKERAIHYRKRKKKVAALFDNEPDALVQAAQLARNFPQDAIVRIDADKSEADIEDVFTEDDYLKAVNAFYSRKFRDARGFLGIAKRDIALSGDDPAESPRIVKRLEKFFLSHVADGWGSFDKRGVCDFFCDELVKGLKLSTKSKERFDALFAQIRSAVESSGTVKKTVRPK